MVTQDGGEAGAEEEGETVDGQRRRRGGKGEKRGGGEGVGGEEKKGEGG